MNCPKDKKCCWDCENGYIQYDENGRPFKFHCLLDSPKYEQTCVGHYSRPKDPKKEMAQKIGDLIIEAVRQDWEDAFKQGKHIDYCIAEYLVDNGVILLENNISGE